MALQDKYKTLIDATHALGVANLSIGESDGVLHIQGTAPSENVKQQLWNIYGSVDPNFLTGDVVMNIDIAGIVPGSKLKVITQTSNLNIRKAPGTNEPVIGKAAKGEIVTLVDKSNDQWWIVRTNAGIEGYCYSQYLALA